MSRRPTPEQQAAIDAAGEVLVSASAGSGKTFVMVEKIISLILSGKADVSSVLAVTFTNLAASEMKERLRAAIVARINEETDAAVRARLKRQLSEIGTSDVCTLHSFCVNVIRRHYYETGEGGNFRVADETEADKLRARAVSLTFDALLREGDADFALLSEIYAGSAGFSALEAELLSAYSRVVSRADYRDFLASVPALYSEERFDRVCGELLGEMKRRAARMRKDAESLRAQAAAFAEAGALDGKYVAWLDERIAFARMAEGQSDLFSARAALSLPLAGKPSNAKLKKAGDVRLLALDSACAALKKATDGVRDALPETASREEEEGAFFASGKVAAAMARLLSAFDEQYAQVKRRAGVLDFSDLEHKCLELLGIERVREAVRGRYTHVFVDEYQDVNPAQERILSLVAGENVFMVGDAKQSIYGFRGCSARFFTEKYRALKARGRALELNGNFRSSVRVLDAVNDLFTGVMTQETGSVDYAATSRMRAGDPVRQAGGSVCFEYVPEREEEERAERDVYSVSAHAEAKEEEDPEGALIASIVLSELEKEHPDPQTGAPVRNGYGDIAILTRKNAARAERIVAELVRRGIPVCAAAEVNICDYPEVRAAISLLQFLDNGEQDIPLAASLKNVGGLTDAELADIRLAAGGESSFCDAVRAVKERGGALGEKVDAFLSLCERLRLLAQVRTAAQILALVLSETGAEARLLSLPCGGERVRRVHRLIAEAGELSVGEFLEKLRDGGYKVGFSESGGENAVRMMSMHAAKGLEFPVVIVAGLNETFSTKDFRGTFYDDEWGFAMQAYDTQARTRRETLLRALLRRRMVHRRAEDEMRLLYVALTRARNSLHLVFSKRQAFDADKVAEATNFACFIDADLFASDESPVFAAQTAPPAARVLTAEGDARVRRAVEAQYAAPYPHADSLNIPVKTSASALLRARREEEGQSFERPPADAEAQDAETGTAYHAFLERADFSAPPAEEAARLYRELCAEGETRLDEKKMRDILSLPIFRELEGYTLYREREFLLTLPACEVFPVSARDEVLVQGVIDLMAVRGGECLVVDYKFSSHSAKRLARDYAPQLSVYAAAARRAAGVEKVRTCLLNILRGEIVDV